jgi:predicted RNase H-like HicB family nuclease
LQFKSGEVYNAIMDIKILNYRVIIEKEKLKDKFIYVAYAPSLGLSDFGKSIEDAVKNIKMAIKLYIETLIELKKSIPHADSEDYFVTTTRLELDFPSNKLAFC